MNRLIMILSWLAIAALTSCAVNAPTEPAGQLGKRYKSTKFQELGQEPSKTVASLSK